MSRLAAFVSPGRSLADAAGRARTAEELGYELVLTNHIANRDGLVVLAAYARSTSVVRLGTGVYPAFLQSTVSLAQQAATLDEIIGGRLVLGIGTSHRPVLESWHGRPFPASPLQAMRETITALRALFRSGEVQADGEYVRIEGFRFNRFEPRPDLPIYVAALGPRMLELAGELADGVVLWLADPGYVTGTVVPHLREGARRVGRDPDTIEVVAAVTCAVTETPGPALAAFRRTLTPYLSLPFYRAILEDDGFGEDIERFDAGLAERDLERALAGVSDDMVHRLAGIGSAQRVRDKIAEYRSAGVTLPGVGPLSAADTASFEDTLAAASGARAG